MALSWRQDSFADYQETQLHVRFEAAGDRTRVTVEHFGWDTIPARHGFPLAVFQLRYAEWWHAMMTGIAESVGPQVGSGLHGVDTWK